MKDEEGAGERESGGAGEIRKTFTSNIVLGLDQDWSLAQVSRSPALPLSRSPAQLILNADHGNFLFDSR
jgi:hypothetical protein